MSDVNAAATLSLAISTGDAAKQLQELKREYELLQAAFAKGDAVVDGVDWLKQHPGVVGAVVAVAAILRPKRVWRWGRRGFLAWQGWQAIRKRLQISG